MELLAPAGDREAMVAAVQCGADAVYLGYTAFGARGYAGNFDEQGLRGAIDYCHERDCRVYVTVNTLVKEHEMPALYRALALFNDAGADAIIVQDVGVAAVAHHCFPDLPLHASTQMALHNAQGVTFARKQGFTRVVAARECPLTELTAMAQTGVGIEAFAHGALCVSVSGQCLFSGMVGGRSGNRGRCAQPCRLPYRTGGGAQNYLLSMRDLMTLEYLPQLAKAGVTAIKIEGRMRRAEYVAAVVASYRRALDALKAGAAYTLQEAERDALLQVFHRGGFTKGHALGVSQGELIDASRPGHGGLEMGAIVGIRNGLAEMIAQRPLHDGDGLQVRAQKQDIEKEFTYSGPDVSVGSRALLRVPFPIEVGDAVFRLTDAPQMHEARLACAGERRRVPVDAVLAAFPGIPATLTLTDGAFTVAVATADPVAPAEKRALDIQGARRQIERMGDTPYALRSFELHSEGAFVSASALNALRRDALDALGLARKERPVRRVLPLAENPSTAAAVPLPLTPYPPCQRGEGHRSGGGIPGQRRSTGLIAQTNRLTDAKSLLAAGADAVCWSPLDYRLEALQRKIKNAGHSNVWFMLPPLAWSEELKELAAWVRAAEFNGVVLTNPGHLAIDWGELPKVADATLHAWNRYARYVLAEWGCQRATLPPELNAGEIAEAMAAGGAWEMVVYERTQLMLLSHYLPGEGPLIDRKGYAFPQERLRMAHGWHTRLLNSVPTWLTDKHARALRSLAEQGNLSWRLRFTDEPLMLCEALICRVRARLVDRIDDELDGMLGVVTSGHFSRGVE
ncbi:MAG: U32 family peptidase, partial [Clostridia bacterium]|nr:U32 family peptidase [Clostridia bacterium]